MCRLRALKSEKSTYFHYRLSVVIRQILSAAVTQLNRFLCPNGIFFPRNPASMGLIYPKNLFHKIGFVV